MLKEKLQSSDQKHKKETGKVPENNQVKAKPPKKRQVIIAGDSMLNNIEEKFDLNTKTSNVSVRSFSGATIEDMKDYSTPLLRKVPNVIIIHAGMNNVRTDKPSIIVDKLVKLEEHIIKIAPSTRVVLSNIIRRHDYKQEQLDKKIIETNSLLAVACKQRQIDLIDNISVTGIGKKGLHPNNLGKEQIAGNLLTYISGI